MPIPADIIPLTPSDDSEIGPSGLPLNPVSSLTDLQVKAYENRVRERLMAKYPTLTLTEARRLDEQIQSPDRDC
jgi:hypothetical protein